LLHIIWPVLKTPASFGLFFGMGFLCGFFVCLATEQTPRDAPPDSAAASVLAVSADSRGALAIEGNIDLALEDERMDSDENGLFITGTVKNISAHSFDAARIAFDLCDRGGEPYTVVTDRNAERMEPGDVWGFTIYIPYTDMDKFSSYRLQSIMGITR